GYPPGRTRWPPASAPSAWGGLLSVRVGDDLVGLDVHEPHALDAIGGLDRGVEGAFRRGQVLVLDAVAGVQVDDEPGALALGQALGLDLVAGDPARLDFL